jgi:FkbH-like protein
MPYERCFGNFDHKAPGSLYAAAALLNARIAEEARTRAHVLINDVEAVASWMGRRHWFDDRLWDLAKSFCALDQLPHVAANIARIICSLRGRVVKCVVLDLDNTLWGGVIGDDGVAGIKLNAHGDGEAFYRLQAFLKELLKRGVLLAVASKNEMENALTPFESHPEMLLKREDISVFLANWNDKAENIRAIRETLNIGLDSMLFLDDNPFERNLVRGILPEVIVPELPEDPADYVRALCELNLFETASFSAEDARRVELYREEAARRTEQARFADADAFLESLGMQMEVGRFDRFHLPRIAQLIQRSNQFNLTTHRYTEAECEAIMNDRAVLPLYARLSDRLGDHGLIGVIVLSPEGEEIVIRDWLMSCRVLARGVEQHLMNLVVEEAQRRGCTRVSGEYIRTAKNGMVSEFFAQFGFTMIGGDPDHTLWVLPVQAYEPVPTFIRRAVATAGPA